MTLIQRQRLIGAILLLFLMGVTVYFLIGGTTHTKEINPQKASAVETKFTSLVEPIYEDEVEILDYAGETLLDPQNFEKKSNDVELEIKHVEQVAELENTVIPKQKKPIEQMTEVKQSWVLQLGSFSVKENADALAAKVNKLGYITKVERTQNDKGRIYRVRLMPEPDKTKFEQAARSLKQALNINAQLLQHNP